MSALQKCMADIFFLDMYLKNIKFDIKTLNSQLSTLNFLVILQRKKVNINNLNKA